MTRHGNLDAEHVRQAESATPTESRDAPIRPGVKPASSIPVDPPPPSGASGDPAAEFLAWSRAQAKQSDDAHQARIRAHVERPVPPTSEADHRSIELAQRTCLAIRHVYPPQHPQRSRVARIASILLTALGIALVVAVFIEQLEELARRTQRASAA